MFIGEKVGGHGVLEPWLRGWRLMIPGAGIESTSPTSWQKCKMPGRVGKGLVKGIIWILCRIGVNNYLGNTNKWLNHVGVV